MLDKNDLQAIAEMLKPITSRLDSVDSKLDSVQQELQRVAITQENEVLPKLQLVYENQIQVIDEHNAMSNLEKKVEVLEDDVFALKAALKELKGA